MGDDASIIDFVKCKKGVVQMTKAAKRWIVICLVFCMAFSAFPQKAHADYAIDKVLVTTSHSPVALMSVSFITASNSTAGCDIVAYNWLDANGVMTGQFSTAACTVQIRLQAQQGFYFSENVAAYLNHNGFKGVKYVALFDYQAACVMTMNDLLWLAMANTDPRRDVRFVADGALLFDARSKHPSVGDNPKRFPNVVMSSVETIRYVDQRWAEYGLGEMILSPSRRYRKLWLSPNAEW